MMMVMVMMMMMMMMITMTGDCTAAKLHSSTHTPHAGSGVVAGAAQ